MTSPRDAPASARRASRRVFARLREGARLVPQEAGPAPQATTLAGIRRKRKKNLVSLRQLIENAQNGNGQALSRVGITAPLAPYPLGVGASAYWPARRVSPDRGRHRWKAGLRSEQRRPAQESRRPGNGAATN